MKIPTDWSSPHHSEQHRSGGEQSAFKTPIAL